MVLNRANRSMPWILEDLRRLLKEQLCVRDTSMRHIIENPFSGLVDHSYSQMETRVYILCCSGDHETEMKRVSNSRNPQIATERKMLLSGLRSPSRPLSWPQTISTLRSKVAQQCHVFQTILNRHSPFCCHGRALGGPQRETPCTATCK